MRLNSVKSFKRRAMGDGTHGPFILGPSEVPGMAPLISRRIHWPVRSEASEIFRHGFKREGSLSNDRAGPSKISPAGPEREKCFDQTQRRPVGIPRRRSHHPSLGGGSDDQTSQKTEGPSNRDR
jgi:hypothetical protein